MSRYTLYAGARDESDNPVGIINEVLGKRAFNKDGTLGTGALKVSVNCPSDMINYMTFSRYLCMLGHVVKS